MAELLVDLHAKGIVHGAVRADNVWIRFSDLADKPRTLDQPVGWFKRDEIRCDDSPSSCLPSLTSPLLSGNWKPFRETHSVIAETAYAAFASEMHAPHLSFCVALSDRTALNLCENFRFNRLTFQRTAALRILRPPEETLVKDLRLTEDTQLDALLGGFDVARRGAGEVAVEKLCKAIAAPEVLRTGHVSPAADIYAFSMFLCELLVAPVQLDGKGSLDDDLLGRRPKVR